MICFVWLVWLVWFVVWGVILFDSLYIILWTCLKHGMISQGDMIPARHHHPGFILSLGDIDMTE